MAFSETLRTVSLPAGTTFAASDMYKFVVMSGSNVVLPNTTSVLPIGVLYGRTSTTNSGQAVTVAISGIAKVQIAASTSHAANYIAAGGSDSTNIGYGIAPTTDNYVAGQIVSGSSGVRGRLASVNLFTGSPQTL